MAVTLGVLASLIAVGIAWFMLDLRYIFLLTGFLALTVFSQIVAYLWLTIRAESKARFVEEVLPDALLLMAMNIKSGMTTDRALIIAARPEFGPLEKELTRAGKQLLGGKEIKYALSGIAVHIKSKLLDRTIRLVIEGIESGGELSSLLEQTAEDIQNTRLVTNEVRSNMMMYCIFIFFSVAIGAPLLFGISTYLVGSVGGQIAAFQSAEVLGQSSIGVSGGIGVTPQFLTMFALISLTITSLFGGMIIGIVRSGSERNGLKMIPVLLIISYAVFFVVRMVVSSTFTSF